MASSLTICNKALSHLGIGKPIASLTENSAEAQACNLFYDEVLEVTLRDFEWPFATKYANLVLDESEPNDEWGFSYIYPTNCLAIRKILSGVRSDTEDTKVPYEIGQNGSGAVVIYTDLEDAVLKYTIKSTNAGIYPPDFVLALSFHMASFIAARITGGDKFKLGERALVKYLSYIASAQSNSVNELNSDIRPESEFIRGRE
jgi:hypothetical protein